MKTALLIAIGLGCVALCFCGGALFVVWLDNEDDA